MPPPSLAADVAGQGAAPLTVSVPCVADAAAVELAELPDRVLPLTVSVPSLSMPPPSWPAELPDRVLLLTVSVPPLRMPPPSPPPYWIGPRRC